MKVSVIIPLFCQEELIIKALESIPDRDDVETIIIDDYSTDDSLKSVSKYMLEHKNKNVRLYFNSINKGVGHTVNRGYDVANGEYIVLLGSDDYFITDEFIRCLDLLDGTDLIYFNLRTNNGTIFNLSEDTKWKYCGSTKFMRREFIGNTRCPELRRAEDFEFYKKLINKNPTEKFTNITAKHYNYPRIGSLTDIGDIIYE